MPVEAPTRVVTLPHELTPIHFNHGRITMYRVEIDEHALEDQTPPPTIHEAQVKVAQIALSHDLIRPVF